MWEFKISGKRGKDVYGTIPIIGKYARRGIHPKEIPGPSPCRGNMLPSRSTFEAAGTSP